jgi:NAD(P)-dependent dehydrogenase (short-subunit alcohol dehydrogenase family)
VVSDISEKGGNETLKLIKATGAQATFVKADASKAADHAALVKAAVDTYGGLHIACNNAGITVEDKPTADFPIDGWDNVINVNLSGVFYGMKHQIPAMLASGGGSIINMSSVLGQVGFPGGCAYVASKHGTRGSHRHESRRDKAGENRQSASLAFAFDIRPSRRFVCAHRRRGGPRQRKRSNLHGGRP